MKQVYEQVSKETGIPVKTVRAAYTMFWKFIRNHIKELPLKEDLTEEQFNELRCNFNIPSLGKLCCTYDRYIGVKKRLEHLIKLKEKHD